MDLIKTETAARQQRRARVGFKWQGEGEGRAWAWVRDIPDVLPAVDPVFAWWELRSFSASFSLFGDIEGIAAFVFG